MVNGDAHPADHSPPNPSDVEFYEADVWSALEDLIRGKIMMELALRRIEIIAGGNDPNALNAIKEIAREGLNPPKENE